MTVKELRKLTIEELKDKISELRKELIDLEFKVRTAQESDTSSLRKTKKDIARAFTILSEKLAEGDVVEEKVGVQEEVEVKSNSEKK